MTPIKKLLDEARDASAENALHLARKLSPNEQDIWCAGFDANKEIIVGLVETLGMVDAVGMHKPYDKIVRQALAKVEASLRGMNENN